MLDEQTRKQLALEHCWRVNAGDLDGLLELYAPDVRFEDPVGSGVQVGREAFRRHAAGAIATGVHEEPGRPLAAQDGRQAAVQVTGVMPYQPGSPLLAALGLTDTPADPAGKVLRVNYVMVIEAGSSGLIERMWSYWGLSDITVVDESELPFRRGPRSGAASGAPGTR